MSHMLARIKIIIILFSILTVPFPNHNHIKIFHVHVQAEMLKLSGRLQKVSDTQRNLQDKLDNYHTDKSMLLEELERSGAISVQTR